MLIHDFSLLEIKNIIIHEVLKPIPREDKKPPVFSEIESDLNGSATLFLKNKVIDSMGSSSAHDILFEENSSSPVPEVIQTLLNKDYDSEQFIKLSKELANHLNESQSGSTSPGFILVLHGTNQDKKVIAILKLEKEEGAQLNQSLKNGKKTFEITSIHNLILSKNTRLFKIAIFFKENEESYSGSICDNQLNRKGDVAHFFISKFLGCRLKADYAQETKKFYQHSLDFIKNEIDNPYNQNICKLHLQSYVQSNARIINMRTFAINYLETNNRQRYENYLREKDIPLQIFKDTSYIENELKKHLYEFENGVKILGTREDFEDQVKLEPLENGDTRATVESRIQKI